MSAGIGTPAPEVGRPPSEVARSPPTATDGEPHGTGAPSTVALGRPRACRSGATRDRLRPTRRACPIGRTGVDVGAWLRGLGLGQYEQVFRDNDVDADLLPGLTADDLSELGITSLGHRKRLLAAV